ncbi:MAG: NINE protein [Edaphobacter sp.]
MLLTDPLYTQAMTDHQRAWFYAEYERARKDEVLGVILAIFLGSFGVHHFYLRRNGLGVLYLLFSWTCIPTVLGWIDAFFTPGRVRQYNAAQAAYISSEILGSTGFQGATPPPPPPTTSVCSTCGSPLDPAAAFCPRCGTATGGHLSTRPAL